MYLGHLDGVHATYMNSVSQVSVEAVFPRGVSGQNSLYGDNPK